MSSRFSSKGEVTPKSDLAFIDYPNGLRLRQLGQCILVLTDGILVLARSPVHVPCGPGIAGITRGVVDGLVGHRAGDADKVVPQVSKFVELVVGALAFVKGCFEIADCSFDDAQACLVVRRGLFEFL